LYDLSRFRQRLGLAHNAPDFAEIAHATLQELRKDLDGGIGKSVYYTYITCIEKYFLPYFEGKRIEELTYTDMKEFELWRNRQMGKAPKASTLNNFSSTWSKLQQVAVNKGWLSDKVAIPKLTSRGQKSTARPAFSREEMDKLLLYMESWVREGRLAVEREIRPLLRDYVEMLLLTGMRHGTEALGIKWQHIEWHTDKGIRYLRIWVSGKTGGRWLIAKHVEWHPKLSHFEENLHPNLSHPNRLSCLIFEQGWARSDQRGNFEQITQTCPSRQGLHPTS
jgi:hypothetical protein